MKVTYTPLIKIEDFWDDRDPPATPEQIQSFESEHKVKVPALLKNLFLISNGGRTEHSCIHHQGQYLGVFPEWIPPIKKWQSLADYIEDFGLDDEDTLEFNVQNPGSFICYRHGFEVFTLFWSSPDPDKNLLGFLDLNAPIGAKDRFVRLELTSDPTRHFVRPHYK